MAWAVLGDSVIGTAHLARDIPCQDAFRFRKFRPGDEWLVVAVADGAGSAPHSDRGATIACDEFIRRIEALGAEAFLTQQTMIDLVAEVRNVLAEEAERLGARPRDLACTALLAVIGPGLASFAQIGDGAIVLGHDLEHRTAFWPDPAEYANTTDFITDDSFADALHFAATTEVITDLAVFTDGLQRLALDFTTRLPYAPFFRPLFSELRSASPSAALEQPFREFLDSSMVNERTDDDKTLVIAVRRI